MKIFKYLLFLLLIAFIASSIYIATKDGEYIFEKSRVIDAPASLLFKEVQNYRNWETWSWIQHEESEFTYSEVEDGETTGFSWVNAEIPDGSITTTAKIPYSSLQQELILQTSITDTDSKMYWNFEPLEEGTKVTWGISGNHSFKEKIAFTLRNEGIAAIFGPVFEQGLEELETVIIRKMEAFSISVDGTTQHGGGYYMYTTTAARISEVHEKGALMIQQVSDYMEENGISINGKPFILYNQRDEQNGTAIFSAAVPTPSQVITPSGSPVLTGYLPAQKVVKTTLKGNHKNVGQAWETAYRYIEENELEPEPRGEVFEIYITNPTEVENPALWVTEIYIPVQ